MPSIRAFATFAAILALAAPPAAARPGWGGATMGPGWGAPRTDPWPSQRLGSTRDAREGKVDADSFVAADAGAALGHGAVSVTTLVGSTPAASDQAAYEAALVDQLVKAGYDTAAPDPEGGQRAEIRIVRDVLVPEEQKRKPVSGEMAMGVDSRGGSMMGVALAVDLRKPLKALVSTRMEVRLLDKASGKPLWEGRAEIATREGDSHWTEQAIATRLAAALFERFPGSSTGSVASR